MSKLALLLVLCVLRRETSGQSEQFPSKHVDIKDFPYHVSVRRSGQHVCSGALVHDSWIITAASCVYDSSVPKMSVALGSSELRGTAYLHLSVSKIIVHRIYDAALRTNNIALLKVQLPVISPDAAVLPIFLPSSENYHLKDGSVLVVSGWKKLQEDRFDSQLSVTGAPLVNQRTCIRSMPSYKVVSAKMLCAGYSQPAEGTCQGDVGAPLANDDILVGILSWGDGCRNSKYPAIYTKISSFLPWISKMMALHSSM